MPFGWIIAGAAVVDAGVNVYNANQAHDIASSQLSMEQTVFSEQQQYASMLQQLVTDPSSVTSLPGYQFQLDQGTQAVARQMAASGFLGSGNEATALTQYGQGLASSFYNTQANLLASLAGLTNPSSPSQLGNAATSANQNAASQWNNFFGQAGILAGRYGSAGTPSAYDTATLAAGGYSSIGPTMPGGGGYTFNTPGYPGGGGYPSDPGMSMPVQ